MSNTLNTKVNILHFYLDYKKSNLKEFFNVHTVNNDILSLDCVITGKPGTIWESGQINLRLSFPEEFPEKPPQAAFIPTIYHPNVGQKGEIKLSLLEPNEWKKDTTLMEILKSAQSMLDEPDTGSAVNIDANNAYLRYKRDSSDDEYAKKVKECIEDLKNKE